MGAVPLEIKRVSFRNGSRFDEPPGFSIRGIAKGIFESFLARKDPAGYSVIGLKRHFERLARGNEFLGSAHFEPELLREQLITHLKDVNLPGSAVKVRVIITPDEYFLLLEDAKALHPETKGIAILPIEAERARPELKTCPAEECWAANEKAQRAGFHEALLLGPDEAVREGAWSNFFWFDRQGNLHTPQTAVLPGVTRAETIELAHGRFTLSFDDASLGRVLSGGSEAFVTSAFRGVLPVVKIGPSAVGGGEPGARTLELRRAYLNSPAYEII